MVSWGISGIGCLVGGPRRWQLGVALIPSLALSASLSKLTLSIWAEERANRSQRCFLKAVDKRWKAENPALSDVTLEAIRDYPDCYGQNKLVLEGKPAQIGQTVAKLCSGAEPRTWTFALLNQQNMTPTEMAQLIQSVPGHYNVTFTVYIPSASSEWNREALGCDQHPHVKGKVLFPTTPDLVINP
ncbi:MAG: hypothetical protein AB7F31_04855 [Parachlamydiales bacterium]